MYLKQDSILITSDSGLLVGHGEKGQILWDFQGQICGKNCRFCGNFAGIFEPVLLKNDR